jgi:septal ring factor EnvC (AmiA/AmiB activator)
MNQVAIESTTKKINLGQTAFNFFITILTAFIVVYSFYFNTTNMLSKHSEDIREVKTEVSSMKQDLNNVAVFKGVSETEIKELKGKVDNIDGKMDKMNDKLDKILFKTK